MNAGTYARKLMRLSNIELKKEIERINQKIETPLSVELFRRHTKSGKLKNPSISRDLLVRFLAPIKKGYPLAITSA